MLLLALWRRLGRRSRPTSPPRRKPALSRGQFLEELEDRTVFATQVVNLGGLTFVNPAGFIQSGSDWLASGGMVQLGLTPTNSKTDFVTLLDIDLNRDGQGGGILRIQNTATTPTFQLTDAELESVVQGGVPIPIWQTADDTTPVPFNVNQLLSSGGFSLSAGTPFKVAGFDFTLNGLQFVVPSGEDTSESEVWMQGVVSFGLLQDKTTLSAPTVAINGPNHVAAAADTGITLTGFTAGVGVQGKSFNAQSIRTTNVGVTVQYSNANNDHTWTFDGSVQITTQPQGTGNDPALSNVAATLGMILRNGDFAGIDFSIAGSFSILGLQVQTDPGKPIDVNFDVGASQYVVSGSLNVSAPDAKTGTTNTIDINLGDGGPGQEGVVIQDGRLTQFNATVNADFTLFGAAISTNGDGLNFSYDGVPGQEQFEMYGEVMVTVPNGKDSTGKDTYTAITALMGDSDSPGLLIKNGALTQINMGLTGEFRVYGLLIEADALNCDWVAGEDLFELSGSLALKEVFSITASLGTSQNPGLKIVNGRFQLDDFTFTADDLRFGAFVIQELQVAYTSSPTEGYTVGITLDLSFPSGWAVGGTLTIDDGKVADISLFLAANTDTIPIGPTGLFLTYMSASVQNIDDPANLIVSGAVACVYGEQVQLLGHGVSIAAFEGSFFVDKDELILDGTAALAAVQQHGTNPNSPPTFNSYLGEGTAKVTLDWGDQEYKADVNVSILDGTFTVEAEFEFSANPDGYAILFQAQADVNIPDFVPIIGGTTLTSMNFVFDYRSVLIDPVKRTFQVSGLVAAWLQEHIIWKFDVGFEYEFGSGTFDKFSLIGSKGVAEINKQITQQGQSYTYKYTYQVPAGATGAVVKIDWPGGAPPAFSITPPGSTVPIGQDDFAANGIQLVPTQGTNSSQNIRIVGSTGGEDTPLPSGQYEVIITSSQQYSPEPTFHASFVYPKPTIATITATGGADVLVPVTVGGTVDEAFASPTNTQTRVSLYADSSNSGYRGTLIPGAGSIPVTTDGNGNWSVNAQWDIRGLLPVNYYVYAVINDGVNAPVFSAYSAAVTPEPPLYGSVTDPEHDAVVLSGISVYLDTNNNGVYDPSTDPVTTTGSTGFYAFYTTDSKGNTVLPTGVPVYVGVVVPPGFESQSPTPVQVTYEGTNNLSVNFELAQLAAISGLAFEDLNENGMQDLNEPGEANVPLYIENTATGQRSLIYSGSDGGYTFRGLTSGQTYQVGMGASTEFYQTSPAAPGTYTVAVTSPYQLVTGQNFGVLPFGEVSGNVASAVIDGSKLDPARTPLAGWKVSLLSGGQVVATTTSASDGSYEFTGLRLGDYTVSLAPRTGYRQVVPYQPNPQFAPPGRVFASGGAPGSITAGDFDGNGSADFAVTAAGGVVVYWGNGNGSFTTQRLTTAFGNPVKVVVFEPGTGMALAVASQTGQVQVFQNTGGTNWSNQGIVWTLPAGSTFNNMVAGDFQDDVANGPPRDLAVIFLATQPGEGRAFQLATLLSNATRDVVVNTSRLASFTLELGTPPPLGLASGYINDDGHDDVLITAWVADGSLDFGSTIAYGFGNGAFSLNNNAIDDDITGGIAGIADVNGDGLLDVVVGGTEVPVHFGMDLYLNEQAQQPYFQSDRGFGNYLFPSTAVLPVGSALATFAGGVLPDLVVVLPNGAVNVFPNQGSSHYYRNEARTVLTLPAGSAPTAFASADVNNDGLPDLLIADGSAQGVRVLLNQSANTTGIPVTLAPDVPSAGNDFVVVQTGAVSGTVVDDANRNGVRDPGERGLAHVRVYLDVNGNGEYDRRTDPVRTTRADGSYSFPAVPRSASGVGVLTLPRQVATGVGDYRLIDLANGGAPGSDFTLARRLIRPIPDQTVRQGATLTTAVRLMGAVRPFRPLYSLAPEVPAGVRIHPTTGLVTWATGGVPPGTYTISVRVTNALDPTLTEVANFRVTVRPRVTTSPPVGRRP